MIVQQDKVNQHSKPASSDNTALFRRYRKSRDDALLTELFTRFHPPAYRLAKQILGDPAAAEDAVQNAMIQFINKADGFQQSAQFGPWAHAILMNAIRMERRGRQRRSGYETKAALARSNEFESAATSAERKLDSEALNHALRSLSEEDQTLLIFHYFEKQSQSQIATRLGVSQATVSRRLSGIIKDLQSRLKVAVPAITLTGLTSELYGMSEVYQTQSIPRAMTVKQLQAIIGGAASMTKLIIAAAAVSLLILTGFVLDVTEDPATPSQFRNSRKILIVNSSRTGNFNADNTVPNNADKRSIHSSDTDSPNKQRPPRSNRSRPMRNQGRGDDHADSHFIRGDSNQTQSFIRVHRWTDDYLEFVESKYVYQSSRRIAAELLFRRCTIEVKGVSAEAILAELSSQIRTEFRYTNAAIHAIQNHKQKLHVGPTHDSIANILQSVLNDVGGLQYRIDKNRLEIHSGGPGSKSTPPPSSSSSSTGDQSEDQSKSQAQSHATHIPNWMIETALVLHRKKITESFRGIPVIDVIAHLKAITQVKMQFSPDFDVYSRVDIRVQDATVFDILDSLSVNYKWRRSLKNQVLTIHPKTADNNSLEREYREASKLAKARLDLENFKFLASHKSLTDETLHSLLQSCPQIESITVPPGIAAHLKISSFQTMRLILAKIAFMSHQDIEYCQLDSGKFIITLPPPTRLTLLNLIYNDFLRYQSRLAKRVKGKNAQGVTLRSRREIRREFEFVIESSKILLRTSSVREWERYQKLRVKLEKSLTPVLNHWPYQPVEPSLRHEDLFMKAGFVKRLLKIKRLAGGNPAHFDYVHGQIAIAGGKK